MPRVKFQVKYKRSVPGDHHQYGPRVEAAMGKLTGPTARYRKSAGYPRSRLRDGGGYLERHEDGPELLLTIIEQLPNYVSAAAALIAIWMNRKKKRGEQTRVEISGDGFSHSVAIKSPKDAKLAQQIIRHYGKK